MGARGFTRGWTTSEAQGATFVELFFDLVFVFAITSITQLLLHDLSLSGIGHGAIILWLVWWAWTQFTWTLNPADTEHPSVELITLAAAAVAFFMAQAIPDAFGSAGAWFALSYVIVRVLGLGFQLGVLGLNSENATTVRMWVGGSTLGLVAVVVGGFLGSPGREIAWLLAIGLDMLSASQATRGNWDIKSAHFAERHGLIVIIALGESLIAAGVALGDVPRDATFAAGTIAAVLLVCALWWIYFRLAKDELEEHLDAQGSERAGAEARNLYSWGHLPIIAGIIAFAVAIEQVLTHVDEPLGAGALAAMILGVVLYVTGIAYGLSHVGGYSLMPWVSVIAVAAAVVFAAAQAATGLTALVGLTVVLVAFAVWGDRMRRARRVP